MNQAKRETISETVRAIFAQTNLDYDRFPPQIVPLNKIIAEYPLMIVELPNGKTLSTKNAVKFLEIEIGFEMPELQSDERTLSGFLYTAKFGDYLQGCIFTDKGEPTVRRRFSAAHEFGHYLLHFAPLLKAAETEALFLTESLTFDEANESRAEIKIARDFDFAKIGTENKYEMEAEADFFAAELLMPRNACLEAAKIFAPQKFIEASKNQNALIDRLATEFLVSYGAMKRRLEDLEVF